ncbi:response regulator [Echinicola sp. CAU 1574]|uniref:Response regulator n=1 Tax=Echinicola arenosa TaxID=2774144 RepID=A0ABR9AJZ2_9BACT|nr:response regulator [Echinicola arenosa]MBD8488859.1 response regulator [Echinicola arenosa]
MKNKLKCILLVDDDEPTNFINEIIIKRTECTENVVAVQSGFAAIDYLIGVEEGKNLQPDLIFLDINMPAMNGWEFLEEYRKLPEHQKVKNIIIMLTTSLNPDDDAKARTFEEICRYESKPLTADKIQNIINLYCYPSE